MSTSASPSRLGVAALVVAVGLLVATVVAATSGGVGAGLCRDPLAVECHALARSFSIRVGFVAGSVAILMLFTVAGLLRMAMLDEVRRMETARTAWE